MLIKQFILLVFYQMYCTSVVEWYIMLKEELYAPFFKKKFLHLD